MSLFGYYAWHSFKNQIKKMFKTWVLIFIVICGLIGGVIGAGAAKLEEMAENQNPQTEPGIEVEDPDTSNPPSIDDLINDEESEKQMESMVEGIAGIVIFGLLLIFIKGADKNGSAIFLPADVALLFTSPMKPQAVLAFRTMCTVGLVLVTTIYMLFQLPNLILNVGLSTGAAFSLLLAWFFVFLFGQLIKILLYTLSSTNEKLKKYVTPGILGIAGLAVIGFVVFYLTHSMNPIDAAEAYINSGISRYIPIWGWTKGIVGCALENNLIGVLIYTALDIAAAVLITVITWNVKADFYEDAMAKSEETAALQRASQEGGNFVTGARKKDRSEKLLRDGFNHGYGANVYFFKSMYNRRRFATLGYFTKTTFFYLGAAAIVSMLFKFVFDGGNALTVAALALGVMVFYRTLGNPLSMDVTSQYFVLIPEPVGKKIFYSLLGSTVNCILDLLPGFILVCAVTGGNPLYVPAWVLLLASIDLYGTTISTFIALSTPASAGMTLKQVVQIMFIYFGLLPDIALIAIGLTLGNLVVYAGVAVAINLVLTAIFFALSTNFISPKSHRVEGRLLSYDELKTAKKSFSATCFVPLIMAGAAALIQIIVSVVFYESGSEILSSDWFVWILNFIPMYAVGLPLGLLAVRKVPADKLEEHSLGIMGWLKCFVVSIAFMYAGNIVGSLLTAMIGSLTGTEADFAVGDLIGSGDTIWIFIFVVVIGPIIEEIIFRKIFIDRLSKYGMSLAIWFSALAFGLFHGNLNQFFYAAALGLVFGYVYVKTGRLRYSILLHMCINFMGSIVSTYFIGKIDLESLDNIENIVSSGNIPDSIIMFGAYILVLLALSITGIIVFFSNIKKIEVPQASMPIVKDERFKTAYLSAGFICLVIYFVVMTIATFVQLGGL